MVCLITKEQLIERYNISEELIQNAEMQWEDFCEIYDDFEKNKCSKYKSIMEDFIDTYLKDISEKRTSSGKVNVHSVRYRVKDAEHVIVKIIRKKQENQLKYNKLNKDNYEKFITDLIGIRCIVLFKEDWENLHYYLISQFENKVEYYIKDPILDFDDNIDHNYFAEKPKVHIRNGDARECYERVLSPDSVIDNKIYRSIHYIIKYKGIYIEIQVRTLFEEGWGEVDHAVVYPYYQDDKILKEYTELLNRVAGLADEMSSFFNRLQRLEKNDIRIEQQPADSSVMDKPFMEEDDTKREGVPKVVEKERCCYTPIDCLHEVYDE